MRRVTAHELHCMGVKAGPDLPLPSDSSSKIAVKKAQMCKQLQELFGDDTAKWIKALKKVKETATYRNAAEATKIALLELLDELKASVKA